MPRPSFAHAIALGGLVTYCDAFRNEASGGSALDVQDNSVDCIKYCWDQGKNCDGSSMADSFSEEVQDVCAQETSNPSEDCTCQDPSFAIAGSTLDVTECSRLHVQSNSEAAVTKVHIGGDKDTKLEVHVSASSSEVKWCTWDDSWECAGIEVETSATYSVDLTPIEEDADKKWEIRVNGEKLTHSVVDADGVAQTEVWTRPRTHTVADVSVDSHAQMTLSALNTQVCTSACTSAASPVTAIDKKFWSFGLLLTNASAEQCIECVDENNKLFVKGGKLRLKLPSSFDPDEVEFYPIIENNKEYQITLAYKKNTGTGTMVLFIDGQALQEETFVDVPASFAWDGNIGCLKDGQGQQSLQVQGHISKFYAKGSLPADWDSEYVAEKTVTGAAIEDFTSTAEAEQKSCSDYKDCVIEEQRILTDDLCHHSNDTVHTDSLTTFSNLTHFQCNMIHGMEDPIDDCLEELNQWISDTQQMMTFMSNIFGECHLAEGKFRQQHVSCTQKEQECKRKRCVSGQKLVETFYLLSYDGPMESQLIPSVNAVANQDLKIDGDTANFTYGLWTRPFVDETSSLPVLTNWNYQTKKFETVGYSWSGQTSDVEFWLKTNAFTDLTC